MVNKIITTVKNIISITSLFILYYYFGFLRVKKNGEIGDIAVFFEK